MSEPKASPADQTSEFRLLLVLAAGPEPDAPYDVVDTLVLNEPVFRIARQFILTFHPALIELYPERYAMLSREGMLQGLFPEPPDD